MADRGRRAEPTSSRILRQREIERDMKLHHKRLETIGATPKRCGTSEFPTPHRPGVPFRNSQLGLLQAKTAPGAPRYR